MCGYTQAQHLKKINVFYLSWAVFLAYIKYLDLFFK